MLFIPGIFGFRVYQQRKADEARIAQQREEQEKQESERRAREAEEARITRENQEQELYRLERRLNEAEGYLTDSVSAGSARSIASSVVNSLNRIDVLGEFTIRVSAARSRAEGIIQRADEIIRSAEEARIRQAEEEAQRRKDDERQRKKRIAESIITTVKSIPEIADFQLEHADHALPPSSDEIDTPFGKMNVCRIDDDTSSLLDVEALKKILMSLCDTNNSRAATSKYFVFALNSSLNQWQENLRLLESKVFVNISSIKPSHVTNPVNLEDYVTSKATPSGQQNFRLFFKGEGGKYIIVFTNSSGIPELYLGTRDNVQRVGQREFMRALRESIEISERRGDITFYLPNEDKTLETLDVDGKFELFIRQLVAISGGGVSD